MRVVYRKRTRYIKWWVVSVFPPESPLLEVVISLPRPWWGVVVEVEPSFPATRAVLGTSTSEEVELGVVVGAWG